QDPKCEPNVLKEIHGRVTRRPVNGDPPLRAGKRQTTQGLTPVPEPGGQRGGRSTSRTETICKLFVEVAQHELALVAWYAPRGGPPGEPRRACAHSVSSRPSRPSVIMRKC